jgi:hypothetical protein
MRGQVFAKVKKTGLWIRIDLMQIRIRDFDDQKLEKMYSSKNFFIIFGLKIAIYLSLGLHKGRTSYRRSLQPSKREHPALIT